MIRHITYCNELMTRSAQRCSETAIEFGCNVSTIYTVDQLPADFRERNKEILSAERGCGYWLWKPQIILQEIDKCKPDDIVIYTDAGIEFIHNVLHLIQFIENGVLLFGSDNLHCEYCKGDVRTLDETAKQVQASVMLFTPKAKDFVTEWLKYCQVPHFIDDSPSEEPNHTNFKDHRHDQAIITELAAAYDIQLHWWPALYKFNGGQFVYPRSGKTENYPATFYHHRKRNDEW